MENHYILALLITCVVAAPSCKPETNSSTSSPAGEIEVELSNNESIFIINGRFDKSVDHTTSSCVTFQSDKDGSAMFRYGQERTHVEYKYYRFKPDRKLVEDNDNDNDGVCNAVESVKERMLIIPNPKIVVWYASWLYWVPFVFLWLYCTTVGILLLSYETKNIVILRLICYPTICLCVIVNVFIYVWWSFRFFNNFGAFPVTFGLLTFPSIFFIAIMLAFICDLEC